MFLGKISVGHLLLDAYYLATLFEPPKAKALGFALAVSLSDI